MKPTCMRNENELIVLIKIKEGSNNQVLFLLSLSIVNPLSYTHKREKREETPLKQSNPLIVL